MNSPEENNQGTTPSVDEDRQQFIPLGHDRLIAAYGEVCRSYERIDDFRAKLLGLLPLASGAALFSLLGKTGDSEPLGTRSNLYPLVGILGA